MPPRLGVIGPQLYNLVNPQYTHSAIVLFRGVTTQKRAKVAVILDSSCAFSKEHLKFKPLTTVYVPVVHTLQ
jgi:hypothetical protein